jgi:recombination protein RecT
MSEIIQFLRDKQTALSACSKTLTAKQMIQATSIAIHQNRALAKCSKESIYEAVLQAARMGLDCSGLHGHGFLVPYGRQCKFIPGWRGLASIAKRASGVTDIKASVIRENDKFEWSEGLTPNLEHRPFLAGDRGEIVAVYAVAWLENGKPRFEVVERWKLDELKKDSRSDSWRNHFEAMAKKTAIRRLCDALPRTLQLDDALDLEIAAENDRPAAEVLRVSSPDLLVENPEDTVNQVKEKLRKSRKKPSENKVIKAEIVDQQPPSVNVKEAEATDSNVPQSDLLQGTGSFPEFDEDNIPF